MIDAQSESLQLTMCMLTVFSISLFCFVLSDLDQPHHGFFKIDLRILTQCLDQLQQEFCAAISVETVVVGYPDAAECGDTVRMYSKRRCVTCYVGSFLVMDNVVLLAFW
jgi:hypothetical protein